MTKVNNAGIYKITNEIDGKIYIGSTKNFTTRWALHCSIRSNCTKLKAAIQKHGIEHFKFDVLEYTDIENLTTTEIDVMLKETEQYYLDKLQPFDTQGYNIHRKSNGTYGTFHTTEFKKSISGGNHPGAKEVHMYNNEGIYIKTYTNISEAAIENPPASVQTIIRCCKKKSITTGNMMWTYDKNNPPIIRSKVNGKKVAQIDNSGQILHIFSTIKEAATFKNCSSSLIIDVCLSKVKKSKIGKWIYLKI